MWLMRGVELNWAAQPLTGVFEAQDGPIVIVGAFKEHPLRDICRALDLDDLSARPEYATFDGQKAHRAELQGALAERVAQGTVAHWLGRLEEVDILCAPVLPLGRTLEDEQVAVNEMIWTMKHPTVGELRTLANPVKLSATPASGRRPPPRLGEHSREILAEMGYDAERIEGLAQQGIIP
ncbi:MAG: CoA transferase, partial [Chloroflexota bacterium]